ncbi:hypothetical protein [Nostoc parmelioides]|nr:hypothetical protein [Nostoc parmelioides]
MILLLWVKNDTNSLKLEFTELEHGSHSKELKKSSDWTLIP